jgi:hypothetical protein
MPPPPLPASDISAYPFSNPQHFLQAALSHPNELYAILQVLWTNTPPCKSPTQRVIEVACLGSLRDIDELPNSLSPRFRKSASSEKLIAKSMVYVVPTPKSQLHCIAAQVPQSQEPALQLLRRLHIVSAQQIQALLRDEADRQTVANGEDEDMGEDGNEAKDEDFKIKAAKDDDGDDDGSEYMLETEDDDTKEYCSCRAVAYGDMVGCENDRCPYEWFHLMCVGLKEPPPETAVWYCPECRTQPDMVMKMK